MTKANANAAANAQEQQAAQQQILRDLLALEERPPDPQGDLGCTEPSGAVERGHRQGVRDARDHGHRG